MPAKLIKSEFFATSTLIVAPRLIGTILEFQGCRGRIVEVEAYTDDPASHAFKRTNRSSIMYETYGYVYVYTIYGFYHCLNFTTERDGVGAVLIRAVEPLAGLDRMRERRGVEDAKALCSGPGKLCQAFGIDVTLNHRRIGDSLKLFSGSAGDVVSSPRIGITKATDLHWRFTEAGSPFVSRPPRRTAL